MKNNKGFTLVEIIVTIGLLALIASITIPSVITMQNRNKKRNFEKIKETIVASAETYYQGNLTMPDDSEICYIPLTVLANKKYVKTPITNPKTNKEIDINKTYVKVIKDDNGDNYEINYEYIDNTNGNITISPLCKISDSNTAPDPVVPEPEEPDITIITPDDIEDNNAPEISVGDIRTEYSTCLTNSSSTIPEGCYEDDMTIINFKNIIDAFDPDGDDITTEFSMCSNGEVTYPDSASENGTTTKVICYYDYNTVEPDIYYPAPGYNNTSNYVESFLLPPGVYNISFVATDEHGASASWNFIVSIANDDASLNDRTAAWEKYLEDLKIEQENAMYQPQGCTDAKCIIELMKKNSNAWHGANEETQELLHQQNLGYGQQLISDFGYTNVSYNSGSGVWYNGNQPLYK